MRILNQNAYAIDHVDGTMTVRMAATPLFYLDDTASWKETVHGSNDKLGGNCEFVPIQDGYKVWSPAGKPPYAKAWQDTDYWLEATSKTMSPAPCRGVILETYSGSTVLDQAWSDNLIHTVEDMDVMDEAGVVVGVIKSVEFWRNASGGVIFQREPAQTVDGATTSSLRFA